MPTDRPLDFVDRVIAPLLGGFAAVLLFFLMILTCADVIGRYFLNAPVFGAFELTEMMLAALIFAALPLVTLRGEHVTVDVFDAITPDWLFQAQHVAANALATLATGYLAWRLWLRAVNMDAAGETTAQLKLKIAYLTYAMSLLMALTAIAFALLILRKPKRSIPGESVGP